MVEDQYIPTSIDLLLFFFDSKIEKFRLCWPYQPGLIFNCVFTSFPRAKQFFGSYEVSDIESSQTLEHVVCHPSYFECAKHKISP